MLGKFVGSRVDSQRTPCTDVSTRSTETTRTLVLSPSTYIACRLDCYKIHTTQLRHSTRSPTLKKQPAGSTAQPELPCKDPDGSCCRRIPAALAPHHRHSSCPSAAQLQLVTGETTLCISPQLINTHHTPTPLRQPKQKNDLS
jgi:hypothetical protein